MRAPKAVGPLWCVSGGESHAATAPGIKVPETEPYRSSRGCSSTRSLWTLADFAHLPRLLGSSGAVGASSLLEVYSLPSLVRAHASGHSEVPPPPSPTFLIANPVPSAALNKLKLQSRRDRVVHLAGQTRERKRFTEERTADPRHWRAQDEPQ